MKRLAYFCLCLLLNCCRSHDVARQIDGSIITGEITVPVKNDIKLPDVAFIPDIRPIKANDDTSQFRMVAHGGSFFAGSRNGGLYREGQLTSIPELIAHQMQLKSFVSPLFDAAHGNGSGYFLYERNASLPSWKKVANQTAIVSATPLVFVPFEGDYVDNISCPEGPIPTANPANLYVSYPKQLDYFGYLRRFYDKHADVNNPFNSFVDSLDKKTHLVLRFDDMDFWLGLACYSKNLRINEMLHSGYFTAKRNFIENNLEQGRKLVLYNIPDLMDFPVFHLYDVRKLALKNTSGVVLSDSSLLVPSDRVNQLFTDEHGVLLEEDDVLTDNEVKGFRYTIQTVLNANTTHEFAKQYKLPLVDLHGLYKTVLSGKYRTEDGYLINPSFPDGNFFSDDGIHPTAIGNALIANETIKVINAFYGTKIPLINITEFSKRM